MKAVKDGHVPDRAYYYLLDWNDQNRHRELFSFDGATRLSALTIEQFWRLFDIAVKADKEYIDK